jgi:hypothetical protein
VLFWALNAPNAAIGIKLLFAQPQLSMSSRGIQLSWQTAEGVLVC